MKKLLIAGFAALMVVAFTVPAMADMKIGGIVFLDFFYMNEDDNNVAVFNGTSRDAEDDLSTININVPNITRLYARWTNEDNVGLYIESGIGQDAGGNENWDAGDDGYGLRHAYGWWDVTPGFRLLVGKSTTPFSPLTPAQTMGTRSGHLNVIGAGYGEFYSGRFAQVRGSFNLPSDMGRIELTLSDPKPSTITPTNVDANALADVDAVIPRIDLTAAMYFGALKLYPGVFWQMQSYDNVAAGDDDVTSYGLTFGLSWGTGPFSVEGEINYGENWGLTGSGGYAGAGLAWGGELTPTVRANGDIEDAECLGYWVSLGFKVMPNATLYGTFGQLYVENDGLSDTNHTDINSTMYGLRFPIDVAKGFRISPEFFIYDDGDDDFNGTDTDFGGYWLLGAQFQVTF
jgi:hypothetical protein